MEPRKLFNEMLSTIVTPSLKKMGFTKTQHAFYYSYEGNWGIIDFQKSRQSNSTETIFTINVGVASNRILTFLSKMDANKKPDIWDTQWRVRLGHLLPENHDIWWTIDQGTNIGELGQYILDNILNYALPVIHKFIRDEALRDLWLSGKSPSLTNFQRLLFLAPLLKQIGPSELLETTIDALKKESANTPSAITAEVFINKLRSL
jgi:hypothetical protein